MTAKAIVTLLKETYTEWSNDKALRLGAALAYYTIFSIAPLLIIFIAIAGLAFGREAAQGRIVAQIQGLIGAEGATAVQTLIEAARKPTSGIIATIIGVGTLLLGATGVVGELQDALNTIWEVPPRPWRGVLSVIKDRFVSFTMMLGIGFLLLVSLIVSAAVAAMDKFWADLMPGFELALHALNFLISFGVITLLLAMIYRILPDVEIAWSDVWIGAAATSLLFTIGKFLIGLYLGKTSLASAYGAAGSLVIILVWVYYSTQILFFGAEFTQVYANRYGSRITPEQPVVSGTETTGPEPNKRSGAEDGKAAA
jgi:membrane protein